VLLGAPADDEFAHIAQMLFVHDAFAGPTAKINASIHETTMIANILNLGRLVRGAKLTAGPPFYGSLKGWRQTVRQKVSIRELVTELSFLCLDEASKARGATQATLIATPHTLPLTAAPIVLRSQDIWNSTGARTPARKSKVFMADPLSSTNRKLSVCPGYLVVGKTKPAGKGMGGGKEVKRDCARCKDQARTSSGGRPFKTKWVCYFCGLSLCNIARETVQMEGTAYEVTCFDAAHHDIRVQLMKDATAKLRAPMSVADSDADGCWGTRTKQLNKDFDSIDEAQERDGDSDIDGDDGTDGNVDITGNGNGDGNVDIDGNGNVGIDGDGDVNVRIDGNGDGDGDDNTSDIDTSDSEGGGASGLPPRQWQRQPRRRQRCRCWQVQQQQYYQHRWNCREQQ
jgi:hypothetical protein